MKKYIISILIASVFVISAPLAIQKTSAESMSNRDLINLLIDIGVIPQEKIPAVDAFLATLNHNNSISSSTGTTSIKLVTPNGGQTLIQGKNSYIAWRGGTSTVQIGVVNSTFPTDSTLVGWIQLNGNPNDQIYWDTNHLSSSTGSQSGTITPGQYKILVVSPNASGNKCYSGAGCNYDVSDRYFTIVATGNTSLSPIISLRDLKANNYSITQNGNVYPVSGNIDATWCKTLNPTAAGGGAHEFTWGDGTKSCSWFPATHTYLTPNVATSTNYQINIRAKNTSGFISSTTNHIIIPTISTNSSTSTFTLTYNANGATGGTVPINSGTFVSGATTTVANNTGNLIREKHIFTGWSTEEDGQGILYATSSTITFRAHNIVLFAVWKKALAVVDPNFTVSCSGSPISTTTDKLITWTATVTGGGGAYTYKWSGDGAIGGSHSTTTYSYWYPGEKTAKIEVFSGDQKAVAQCSVTITAPIIQPSLLPPSINLKELEVKDYTVNLKGSVSSQSGWIDSEWCGVTNLITKNAGSFEFNWGDGVKTCSSFPAAHTYPIPTKNASSTYQIIVTAKNTVGLTSSSTRSVTILGK